MSGQFSASPSFDELPERISTPPTLAPRSARPSADSLGISETGTDGAALEGAASPGVAPPGRRIGAAGRYLTASRLHCVRRHRDHRGFLRYRFFLAVAFDWRRYRQFRRTRSPYGASRGKTGSHFVRGPVAFRARASSRRGAVERRTRHAVSRPPAGGCHHTRDDTCDDWAYRVGAGVDATLQRRDATRPKITSERD